jgi:hypothetical protein
MAMKHSVPHDLPFDTTKKVVDAALQAYRTRFPEYDPRVVWTGDRTAEVHLQALGAKLKGTFEILESSIEMDMDVPLLMRPFKNKAIEVVEAKIREWIGKAKAGELG